MARDWKCAKCAATNPETSFACQSCGLIRGSVVVPPPAPPAGFSTPGADQSQPPPAPMWSVAATPPAASRTRPSLRVPIGLIVVIGFIAMSAVYGYFNNASRSSSGEIERGGQMSVSDLRVGDCFDLDNPDAEQVEEVAARPCAEAHQYEMVFADAMPEGDYPTDDQFNTYVDQQCLPAFATFVGVGYDSSMLEISWFYPSTNGWSRGDRTVQCAIYDPQQDRITGSLQGAAR